MDTLSVMQQVVPELNEILERRYVLLRTIHSLAPVGRRTLASRVDCSERIVRGEIDVLREQGLVLGSSAGVRLTAQGEEVLSRLQEMVRDVHGLVMLERELSKTLGVQEVMIVPGDSDSDPSIKRDMALITARYLRKILRDGQILAVTGGTTLAKVAESFPSDGFDRDVTVVPARGGLGEDVTIQANSVAARLAVGLGGTYRLLHAPEDVLPCYIDQIMNEPRIRDVIALGRRADVLLHGIGTAEEMARRRGFDDETIMKLIADGAVGEAFGYYFDSRGNIVYSTSSVGLRLEDLERIPRVIAVGGGRSKAWAVMSVLSTGYCHVCITDEGAARRLMNLKATK